MKCAFKTILVCILCCVVAAQHLRRSTYFEEFVGRPPFPQGNRGAYQTKGYTMDSRNSLVNPSAFGRVRSMDAGTFNNFEPRRMVLKHYGDETEDFEYDKYFDSEDEEDENIGGGICHPPRKYPTMGPSRFNTRREYDRYVCKYNCHYALQMCIYRTPNCGRPNIGDSEKAMIRRCAANKASCQRRC